MTSAALPRWGNQARDRKGLAIWRTLARVCGEGINRGHWVDVGCGSGGIAATVASRVRSVTGVDPEPWPDWKAAAGAHANLSFVDGTFDGPVLPLPEGSADVVTCNQVYEHVGDPRALLANIHRVLAPDGVCYFAGPNLLWPVEPHVFWPLVHWLPRPVAHAAMRALGSRRAAELDAYSRTYWTLTSWFRAAGFAWRWVAMERLEAELEVRGRPRLARCARIARPFTRWLAPISPGFAFVLTKAD